MREPLFIWASILWIFWSGVVTVNGQECDRSPINSLVLFDITISSQQLFKAEQTVAEDFLRHLESVSKGRDVSYGFVAYHSNAVVLSSLKSNKSKSVENIVNHIGNIRPRPTLQSAVSNAINVLADQLEQGEGGKGSAVVLIVFNGADETERFINVTKRLWSLGTNVFVITEKRHLSSALLLTKSRDRVFISEQDFPAFLLSLDAAIATCLVDIQPNGAPRIPSSVQIPSTVKADFDTLSNTTCIDTEISVLSVFENEPQLESTLKELNDIYNIVTKARAKHTKIITNATLSDFVNNEVDYLSSKEVFKKLLILITGTANLSRWNDVLNTYSNLENSKVNVVVLSTIPQILPETIVYSKNTKNVYPLKKMHEFTTKFSEYMSLCLPKSMEVSADIIVTTEEPKTSSKAPKLSMKAETTTVATSTKTASPAISSTTAKTVSTRKITETTTVEALVKTPELEETTTKKTTVLTTTKTSTTTTIPITATSEKIADKPLQIISKSKFDSWKCPQGTSITVVVDPQSPKTEDFERQKSLAMELVIALPSTTSLTVYPSNTTSNDKELLLSTITALTIISTKVKNLENLNVKNNGIVIYIHGGVVSTEELVKNFGKLHQSVAVIGTGDKVKELGNAGITVFDFNAVEGFASQFLSKLCEKQKIALVELARLAKDSNSVAFSEQSDPNCKGDLLFVIDTSQSVEEEFAQQTQFVVKTLSKLSAEGFKEHIRVGLITFNNESKIEIPFGSIKSKSELIHTISNLIHVGGPTSLVRAAETVIREIQQHQTAGKRLTVVFVSDGNSQDEWNKVIETSGRLQKMDADIYAVTVSPDYFLRELELYAGDSKRVYVDRRSNEFIEQFGRSILPCNIVETSVDLSPETKVRDESVNAAVTETQDITCAENKMDLIIILDASTSRENVFEHQRELALSLIERLPISKTDTHVATGINSFNEDATLRQSLTLGKDRNLVRQSIEDIVYLGGSTHTAKAIDLALSDLNQHRRKDAVQVVVLMNDGMSQDPWEDVVATSQKLTDSGAMRFGVALGPEVDLRELVLYTGGLERVYRDGSTERFLQDVVSLLNHTNCGLNSDQPVTQIIQREQLLPPVPMLCPSQSFQVAILIDSSLDSIDAGNKNLVLDILGSLPSTENVGVAVFEFTEQARLIHFFTDSKNRNDMTRKVDTIKGKSTKPDYFNGVKSARKYLKENRDDSKKLLIVVGNGDGIESSDKVATNGEITTLVVSNSKTVNKSYLSKFVKSNDQIFDFERNKDFTTTLNLFFNTESCSDDLLNGSGHEPDVDDLQKDVGLQSKRDPFDIEKDVVRSVKVLSVLNNEIIEVEEIKTTTITTTNTVTTKPTTITTTNVITTKPTTITTPQTKVTTITVSSTVTPQTVTPRRIPNTTSRIIPISVKTTKLFNLEALSTRLPKKVTEKLLRPFTLPPITSTIINRPITTTPLPFIKPRKSTLPPSLSGCLFDVLLLLDTSGSVTDTFGREKALALSILDRVPIDENGIRVSVIKFSSPAKVRTLHGFAAEQSIEALLATLNALNTSKGITAIHKALLHAVNEYSSVNGARPGKAQPLALIFTDGFGSKDFIQEAMALRDKVPDLYAVAINHDFPISHQGLNDITGSADKVFTERNINELHTVLKNKFGRCWV